MAGAFKRNQWTVEKREQALLALAEHGSGKLACAGVGLTSQSAHHLRKRDPDFAARWDAAVARARSMRGARQAFAAQQRSLLPDYRVRHDGWTERRQQIFLRALTETGCVRDACARARISSTSAYRVRGRSPAFAKAWEQALRKAAPTIEQAAFMRAVDGWDEVVWRGGEEVSRKRRYSDSLLRLLIERGVAQPPASSGDPAKDREALELRAREAARAAGGFFGNRASSDKTDAGLRKKLDVLARSLRRKAAEEQEDAGARIIDGDCSVSSDAASAGGGRVRLLTQRDD